MNSGKYDQNAYIFVGIELFSYIFGVVLTLTGYHRQGSKVLFAMSTASTLLTYDVYQSGKFQSSAVLQVSKHFAISGGVLLLAAFLSQAGNLNSLKGKIKKMEALVGGRNAPILTAMHRPTRWMPTLRRITLDEEFVVVIFEYLNEMPFGQL